MLHPNNNPLGCWTANETPVTFASTTQEQNILLGKLRHPVYAVALPSATPNTSKAFALVNSGSACIGNLATCDCQHSLPLLAWAPSLLPEQLGDKSFRQRHGLKYAYASGSMANGIASQSLVEAMARHGMLGFFGSAGLSLDKVQAAIASLQTNLGKLPFGFNLINSPNDPQLEDALSRLFISSGIRCLEASAYLSLTLPLLRYRLTGIHADASGHIIVPNQLLAKVSRLEIAAKFLQPAPEKLLRELVNEGSLTLEQAQLASQVPVASDITAEADSGGHTDNRPAISLIPAVLNLRDQICQKHHYEVAVGAAGGISTPVSAAAAFAMGAAYIMTGSINQACLESGSCTYVRQLLSKASPADVTMAPAADMFEMGVNVQVLKWGTMFPVRARKLYDIYRQYDDFEKVPGALRAFVERDCLRDTFSNAWEATRQFFAMRDPRQITKAEQNPKHLMALVFRSYLGQASRWANSGDPSRRPDYQIWCGPAMGAFNAWTEGSFLSDPEERNAHLLALNLLVGACVSARANCLSLQGIDLSPATANFQPHTYSQLVDLLQESANVN